MAMREQGSGRVRVSNLVQAGSARAGFIDPRA
jgi:hypothetical protein